MRTRIIILYRHDGRYSWRAPLVRGKNAQVELVPMDGRSYDSEQSARASATRSLRRLFPDIVIEERASKRRPTEPEVYGERQA